MNEILIAHGSERCFILWVSIVLAIILGHRVDVGLLGPMPSGCERREQNHGPCTTAAPTAAIKKRAGEGESAESVAHVHMNHDFSGGSDVFFVTIISINCRC